jgi:dienelactone hydrolase
MTVRVIYFYFFIVSSALYGTVPIAPNASMNEKVLSIPGDPQRPALLQVTILSPDGEGPFPLVIMNHGASKNLRPNLVPRYRNAFSAYYFLSRGYIVALPMMRGFAGSEGKQILDGCNHEEIGLNNAKDIRAVINFMIQQPYVDSNRIIVAGQSFGGWNTLAFGTINFPNVKGLINFAGGVNISSCDLTLDSLANGSEHFGRKTVIPSLWLYGDNDGTFSSPVWHAMFDHYTAAGGKAELIEYGRFMADAHTLLQYPEGLRLWCPKVDAFLGKLGMPNKMTHPEYLPMEFPVATNFAAIDDINAVPYLTDEGRKIYQKYLSAPIPKVFVISDTGVAGSFNGGFDPLGRAMNACQKRAQKCHAYAVDDQVVWSNDK